MFKCPTVQKSENRVCWLETSLILQEGVRRVPQLACSLLKLLLLPLATGPGIKTISDSFSLVGITTLQSVALVVTTQGL